MQIFLKRIEDGFLDCIYEGEDLSLNTLRKLREKLGVYGEWNGNTITFYNCDKTVEEAEAELLSLLPETKTVKWQVIFKAGYEIDAETEEEAKEKAIVDMLEEIYHEGLKNFVGPFPALPEA